MPQYVRKTEIITLVTTTTSHNHPHWPPPATKCWRVFGFPFRPWTLDNVNPKKIPTISIPTRIAYLIRAAKSLFDDAAHSLSFNLICNPSAIPSITLFLLIYELQVWTQKKKKTPPRKGCSGASSILANVLSRAAAAAIRKLQLIEKCIHNK